ncbi:MAG: NBR1-Ig-like domain-containing protein [Chloroflexota bacterium]
MQDRRVRLAIAALLIVIFALLVAIISLAEGSAPAAATPDAAAVRTQAVRAFIEELTAKAPALSAPTPTRRPPSSPPTIAAEALSGTPNCLGLHFLRDVTIPDNTEMTPAEVFTKTWLVENSGTCPWRPGFQVVLIGGVAMGGSPFKVAQTVGPGGSIQVSIKMAAPTNETGVVEGTWKMADADGVHFGDFMSVVVVVSGPTRIPATTTATAAP